MRGSKKKKKTNIMWCGGRKMNWEKENSLEGNPVQSAVWWNLNR